MSDQLQAGDGAEAPEPAHDTGGFDAAPGAHRRPPARADRPSPAPADSPAAAPDPPALQADEAAFRLLFAANPQPMWIYDQQTLRFLDVNEAAVALYGYTRDEFLRLAITDIRPAEDVPRLLQLVRARPGPYRGARESRHLTKDGRLRVVESTSHTLRVGDRPAVLVTTLDITERKQAEAALRASEDRFRILFEHAPVGLALTQPDGPIIDANPALTRLLGCSREALRGQIAADFTHPEDRERQAAPLRDVLDGRSTSQQIEKRYIRPDGTIVWANVINSLVRLPDGTPQYYVGIAEDITERRRAEAALRASEARFRALIENSSDIISIVAPDGTIAFQSASVARILGCRPEDVVGRRIVDLVHPDDRTAAAEALGRLLEPDAGTVRVELRFQHCDGSWRSFEATAVNLVAQPGLGGIVVNSRDITERRRLEEQLLQGHKMEAIGRLAGGIAHDFNNMLGVILGYTDLLLARADLDAATHGALSEVQRASERAAALTQQLLAFGRKQFVAPRVLDLNQMAGELAPMLRRVMGEDVTLVTRLDPRLGRVRADRGQLEQVLLNLAANARDAMLRGGRFTVETADLHLDQPGAELPAGRCAQLSVSDTGVGMDAERLAHIFEPFYTTKEPGQGTGLGLATVYGIVQQHGGQIEASSEPGAGTTFRITLPSVDPATADALAPSPSEPARERETILLAEDEALLRGLARSILELEGYTVLEASSGEEALAVSAAFAGPIQLLITDVVMPGLGGRELAERLRASRPDTRVLFTSGYTDDAVLHHGVVEAEMAFIAKPFKPGVLARKVRQLLDAPA